MIRRVSRIIVVPDVDAQRNGPLSTNSVLLWPQIFQRPRILEFQYSHRAGCEFSWDQLIRCGDTLLAEILAQASNNANVGPKTLSVKRLKAAEKLTTLLVYE